MNPLTEEWIAKAERDYASAAREYRARRNPNYDLVCFLAQQCAEKFPEGRLQQAGADIERTHNLIRVLDCCLPFEPLWECLRTSLAVLGNYAVAFRYPGECADKEMAKDALNLAKQVRVVVRTAMGPPD